MTGFRCRLAESERAVSGVEQALHDWVLPETSSVVVPYGLRVAWKRRIVEYGRHVAIAPRFFPGVARPGSLGRCRFFLSADCDCTCRQFWRIVRPVQKYSTACSNLEETSNEKADLVLLCVDA